MIEIVFLSAAGVAVLGFLGITYKNIYKEHLDILKEQGPDERPILTFTSEVNYPKGNKLHQSSDWTVGITVIERRDGTRRCVFSGEGSEGYFTNRSAVYSRVIIPLLNGAKLSQIKDVQSNKNLVFYE